MDSHWTECSHCTRGLTHTRPVDSLDSWVHTRPMDSHWTRVLTLDLWTLCRDSEDSSAFPCLWWASANIRSLSYTKHRRKECSLSHDTSSACQGSSWVCLKLPGDIPMKGPYVSWVIFVNNCVLTQYRHPMNILLHLLQRILSCRVGFTGS